jgi:hypothetical protein
VEVHHCTYGGDLSQRTQQDSADEHRVQEGGGKMKTYPSKELCLRMAEYHCETTKKEDLMWTWLVTWAFHEMYVEGWVK